MSSYQLQGHNPYLAKTPDEIFFSFKQESENDSHSFCPRDLFPKNAQHAVISFLNSNSVNSTRGKCTYLGWALAIVENSLSHMGLPNEVFCFRPVRMSVALSKFNAA